MSVSMFQSKKTLVQLTKRQAKSFIIQTTPFPETQKTDIIFPIFERRKIKCWLKIIPDLTCKSEKIRNCSFIVAVETLETKPTKFNTSDRKSRSGTKNPSINPVRFSQKKRTEHTNSEMGVCHVRLIILQSLIMEGYRRARKEKLKYLGRGLHSRNDESLCD